MVSSTRIEIFHLGWFILGGGGAKKVKENSKTLFGVLNCDFVNAFHMQ